jgi:hypothetical protein
MRIILKGRRVGNGDIAVYFQNRAYFTKRGLTKRTVLHELYHHLAYVKGLDMPARKEEIAANGYARAFQNRSRDYRSIRNERETWIPRTTIAG